MKKSIGSRTITSPTPVWVVGSYDHEGRPNVMTAAWGGVCCSKPPCIYVALRKATYTYGNLMERHAFTVNVPSRKYVKETDFFGTTSGRDVNKFQTTGLTPVNGTFVDAPYVEEFPLVLECQVIQTIEIGLHTEFIGEIRDVKAEVAILNEGELPDIQKVEPVLYDPANRTYYGAGKVLGKAFSIGKALHPPGGE